MIAIGILVFMFCVTILLSAALLAKAIREVKFIAPNVWIQGNAEAGFKVCGNEPHEFRNTAVNQPDARR